MASSIFREGLHQLAYDLVIAEDNPYFAPCAKFQLPQTLASDKSLHTIPYDGSRVQPYGEEFMHLQPLTLFESTGQ